MIRHVLLVTGLFHVEFDRNVWWTSEAWWILALYAPAALVVEANPYLWTLGAFLPVASSAYKEKPVRRTLRRLLVCLVSKGTNMKVRDF